MCSGYFRRSVKYDTHFERRDFRSNGPILKLIVASKSSFNREMCHFLSQGKPKSVCFGFPYVDTLKILKKFGPAAIFSVMVLPWMPSKPN